MGVFTPQISNDLKIQLRRLASNFFDAHRFIITADEFIAGFIHPDHVPMLKEVEQICGRIGNTYSAVFDVKTANNHGMRLMANFKESAPIIMPEYVSHGLHDRAPPELRERLQAWVEQRWEYGCIFGDAVDAFDVLNDVCYDARAMTVMMPIIPTLMRNISVDDAARTTKRAKRLAEIKGTSSLPMLPRPVTKRIQEACHLLTALNLIDSVPDADIKKHSAIIYYNSNSYSNPARQHILAGFRHVSTHTKGSFV